MEMDRSDHDAQLAVISSELEIEVMDAQREALDAWLTRQVALLPPERKLERMQQLALEALMGTLHA